MNDVARNIQPQTAEDTIQSVSMDGSSSKENKDNERPDAHDLAQQPSSSNGVSELTECRSPRNSEQRRSVLLRRVLQYYATYYCEKADHASDISIVRPPHTLASLWTEVLPECTLGFLDLRSIVRLRQTCTALYKYQQYMVYSCNLASTVGSGGGGALTEQEIINHILPQLIQFLTPESLCHLNFSRCCLLSDTFPKSLIDFRGGILCRNLRSLLFDFCYALTDKALEILFATSLPCLEKLSLRGARSRDLTGAPISSSSILLDKARWPSFHQFFCSCTQVALCHLDVAASFLAERARELGVTPKLEIEGSIGSLSLIRRLRLDGVHRRFIEALVHDNTLEAVEAATLNFEAEWIASIDASLTPQCICLHKDKIDRETGEDYKRLSDGACILHKLVRNMGTTVLVNAPCSVTFIGDEYGQKKTDLKTGGSECNERAIMICEQCGHPVGVSSFSGAFKTAARVTREADGLSGLPVGRASNIKEFTKTESSSYVRAHSLNGLSKCFSRWSYPLPIAIRLGNPQVVEFLLKRGSFVDVWGYNFASPLYIAASYVTPRSTTYKEDCAKRENIQATESFMARDEVRATIVNDYITIKPSRKDPNGVGSKQRFQDTAEYRSSSPLLGYSAREVCTCQCSVLEEQHPQPPIQNASFVVSNRSEDKEDVALKIVELLLQYCAPVNAPDVYSIKCPVNAAIKNDNKELLEMFLTHGACLNARVLPPEYTIPLRVHESRRQQQKKMSQRGLTRLGYKSSLFLACELNAWRCVPVLLDHGADPHWTDPFSHRNVTPTLLAYRKNPQMLQLFVAKGAGGSRSTRWVLSEVLAAAILQGDLDTVRFLVRSYRDLLERDSRGMWSLPLIQASRLNKVEVVEELLILGTNPNVCNVEGFTSLHLASGEGHKEVVECLLRHGAKINLAGGHHLKTPLHVAVEENRRNVVESLLNFGADAISKDYSGVTPLMSAIASRNDKVAMLLIQRATVEELETMDLAQRTALTYAIYFGQFKVAEALVVKGVTCHAVDASGESPESLLRERLQSLEKTPSSSTLNKFIRNIVGGNTSSSFVSLQVNGVRPVQPSQGYAGNIVAQPTFLTGTRLTRGSISDESVRKLNAKRRKIAKRLLHRIRAKTKKDSSLTITRSQQYLQRNRETLCKKATNEGYSVIPSPAANLPPTVGETSSCPISVSVECVGTGKDRWLHAPTAPNIRATSVGFLTNQHQVHPGDSPISTPMTTKCNEDSGTSEPSPGSTTLQVPSTVAADTSCAAE